MHKEGLFMKKKLLLLLPLMFTSFSVVGCGETNKKAYNYTYKFDTPRDLLDNLWGSVNIYYPNYPGYKNGPATMEDFDDNQDILINGIKNTEVFSRTNKQQEKADKRIGGSAFVAIREYEKGVPLVSMFYFNIYANGLFTYGQSSSDPQFYFSFDATIAEEMIDNLVKEGDEAIKEFDDYIANYNIDVFFESCAKEEGKLNGVIDKSKKFYKALNGLEYKLMDRETGYNTFVDSKLRYKRKNERYVEYREGLAYSELEIDIDNLCALLFVSGHTSYGTYVMYTKYYSIESENAKEVLKDLKTQIDKIK